MIFAGECGLVNIHETYFDEEHYDNDPLPPSFTKGKTKIDHIFCTPRLFD
jgi:hypothetical protein